MTSGMVITQERRSVLNILKWTICSQALSSLVNMGAVHRLNGDGYSNLIVGVLKI